MVHFSRTCTLLLEDVNVMIIEVTEVDFKWNMIDTYGTLVVRKCNPF